MRSVRHPFVKMSNSIFGVRDGSDRRGSVSQRCEAKVRSQDRRNSVSLRPRIIGRKPEKRRTNQRSARWQEFQNMFKNPSLDEKTPANRHLTTWPDLHERTNSSRPYFRARPSGGQTIERQRMFSERTSRPVAFQGEALAPSRSASASERAAICASGKPVPWGSGSTLPAARAWNSDCGENDDKNSRKYAQTITGYHFAFGPARKHS